MISDAKIDTTPPVRANPQAAAGMSFAVLPALIPNIQDIYSVYFSAFETDKMGRLMLDVLFPGGFEGEEFRKAHAKATQDYWGIASSQYTWKVIETQTNAIAGMILADIYQLPRTVEERKNHGVPWLEGEHREKAEAILNPLWEVRERLFGGRPYIYVHVIAVDPKYQGLKAGAMICRWGMETAEALRLPLYFEASPSTVGLYEKMGFQTLKDTVVHKAAVLGTPEDITVPLMVMMPKSLGMSLEEWQEATKDKA